MSVNLSPIEYLEKAQETRVDVKNRIIYFIEDVDTESAKKFIIGLRTLDSTDGEIKVVLSTPGGLVFEGFAMYDAIRTTNNKVNIVGTGQVMSMGAVILQAGDTRKLTKTARFMMHDPWVWIENSLKLDELKREVMELQRDKKLVIEAIAERSKLPIAKVKRLCRRESYFTAEEAVQLSLADEIVPYTELVV